MARLVDVIEQLKENNQTNVDINAGIAGLENMFGAYFANEARRKLEEGRNMCPSNRPDRGSSVYSNMHYQLQHNDY